MGSDFPARAALPTTLHTGMHEVPTLEVHCLHALCLHELLHELETSAISAHSMVTLRGRLFPICAQIKPLPFFPRFSSFLALRFLFFFNLES